MKRSKSLLNLIGASTLFCFLVLATGCQKEDVSAVSYHHLNKSVSVEDQRAAERMRANLPEIGVWDNDRGLLYKFNLETRDFDFSTPNNGWNFSNPDDVQFVEYPEGGGIVIIPYTAFGANTGGTVIAGSSALDINYTFCFSASDEALGLDLFDFGGDFDGVSLVLGIAGNFDALAEGNVDEDSDFTDFFQGFAMYVVYDDEAQGSYDVLNWLEDLEEDPDFLADHSFSYVLDFTSGGGLYFSSDGTITVSGGSMTFSGEYLAIENFIFSLDDEEDLTFSYVTGYGTLGCN
jgi:hypothetical protein